METRSGMGGGREVEVHGVASVGSMGRYFRLGLDAHSLLRLTKQV